MRLIVILCDLSLSSTLDTGCSSCVRAAQMQRQAGLTPSPPAGIEEKLRAYVA
jgi:hypothetical protein